MQGRKEMQENKREITLRDLILKVREYLMLIPENRKYIALISIAFMLIFGIKSTFQRPVFSGTLTFMINEDKGNPLGSISGMLGTFGIENKGKSNIARVLELSTSRRIIENVLFEKASLNDSTDFIANHLITYLDTLKDWNYEPSYKFWAKPDDSLTGFSFRHSDKVKFSDTEKKALKKLYYKIIGSPDDGSDGLLQSSFRAESRIIKLGFNSHDEDMSAELTNVLFDKLSAFYIDKSIEKQRTTYQVLKVKTDSLRNLLIKQEKSLASLEDSWMGRYSNQSKIEQKRLNKEIQFLTIALGESIKNLEIADFAVKNTTPYVQVIDRPAKPLDAFKPSWLISSLIGLITGALLTTAFFFLRKFFLDALSA